MEQSRGRPRKGNRIQISIKVPADQKALLEDAARAEGLPLTDYVATLIAQAKGWPPPAWLERDKAQEALPIGA